jgi:hypothetical protein
MAHPRVSEKNEFTNGKHLIKVKIAAAIVRTVIRT